MPTIEQIKSIVAPIAQKYKLEHMELFGSYAKGTNNIGSDIDLLVKFKEETPSIFDVCGLQEELKQALNSDVDLITLPLVRPDKLVIDGVVKIYG